MRGARSWRSRGAGAGWRWGRAGPLVGGGERGTGGVSGWVAVVKAVVGEQGDGVGCCGAGPGVRAVCEKIRVWLEKVLARRRSWAIMSV